MKMIRLEKQNTRKFEFDELYRILSELEGFLKEDARPDDIEWSRNLTAILDFQDDDGSFKLFDSYDIPSDARVDFCYIPTYICTATLMKAYLTDPSSFTLGERSALSKGLKASCARNLRGHGYDAFKGQIEALGIFMKAGLREFIDLEPDFCLEFSVMIGKIISAFEKREDEGDFTGPWGESYKAEIKAVNEYFSHRNVFVYGTLMSGETNHHFLENSICLGTAVAEGYDMYKVGWYPAIIPGDGLAVGELYRVPIEDIPAIDRLEGEGSLYEKRCEWVTCKGESHLAFVYVYLRDCSDLERISAWKDDYVWYVSYGSNMLKERFLCYIEGGSFEGSRYHPPCRDTSHPLAVRTFDIPYGMYFANRSGSWEHGGVSFLDMTTDGHALGVAYLITREQFEHVAAEENTGRFPSEDESWGWYENIIPLGTLDGFEVKSVTNRGLRPYNRPCDAYRNTLRRGIRQNWPEKSDEDIEDYLDECIR